MGFNGSANITHYATCSTAAATEAKTVAFAEFSLVTGARITVKFSNANTATSPTLNINSTGAKAIMADGDSTYVKWIAGAVMTFVYDGTNWVCVEGYQLAGMRVGTIYQSTNSTSPATLFGGSWTAISSGRYLKAITSGASAEGDAGLPNITGNVVCLRNTEAQTFASGAFYNANSAVSGSAGTGSTATGIAAIKMDASRMSNSLYGKSTTVTPLNYGVYMWRRTA